MALDVERETHIVVTDCIRPCYQGLTGATASGTQHDSKDTVNSHQRISYREHDAPIGDVLLVKGFPHMTTDCEDLDVLAIEVAGEDAASENENRKFRECQSNEDRNASDEVKLEIWSVIAHFDIPI